MTWDAIEQSNLPVAVVTGGSSGIGARIVRDLARDHNVVAVGRDAERLAAVAAEVEKEAEAAHASGEPHGCVLPHVVDLMDLEGLENAFRKVPRVDVLVHCAAIAERFTVETAKPRDWQRHFATNAIAPAEITRVLLHRLRDAAGTVVFIGSGASRVATPGHTVYAASKHALQVVADGLRQQVTAEGVRVSTVAPGPTNTPMSPDADRFRLEPETVARSVRHVVDAPADAQITEVWVRPRY